MTAQVENLANLMRAKKERGEKFVVMLGAGASMSSGVKPTPVIMAELLQKFGKGMDGTTVEQQFDLLWQRTSDADRGTFLEPYLDRRPSSGYVKFAELIDAEYFDLVVTFNFDDLVEKALQSIEFTDYKVMIRGETKDEEMQKLLDAREPRVKLAKLHGSLKSSNHFLFDAEEMYKYPEPIDALVKRITGNDVVVCGYAFADHCVIRAFAEQGGSVVCVNPAGVPNGLRVFLKNRRSEDSAIAADFDSFFEELHRELLGPPSVEQKPLLNPFKFLESYEEADSGSLTGREEEQERFLRALERQPRPHVIVMAGPGRAGKTSLVKAALLPRLDPLKYRGIYLRCQAAVEESVPRDLGRLGVESNDVDLASSLQHLGGTSGDLHVVLFLDQFDRVTNRYDWHTTTGHKQLATFVRDQLVKGCNGHLTLVLVVTDEGLLGAQLCQECVDQGLSASTMVCLAFDRRTVVDIIQSLARKGGIDFDPRIVEDMTQLYERTRDVPSVDGRFTLAHIQAVCHILAGTRRVDYEGYKRAFKNNLEALHQAINVCEIISFVEDFSWPDAVWLRNMIKVPLKESKERIAEFIKTHYEELLPQERSRGKRRSSIPPNAGLHA